MKRVGFWLLLLFGMALGVRAQTPDSEYLRIYNTMQEGEAFERSGQMGEAMDRFRQAQGEFQKFAKVYPNWNEKLVRFRVSYLAGKISSLSWKKPELSVPRPVEGRASSLSGPAIDLKDAERRVAEAEAKVQEALQAADQANARANLSDERTAQLALDLRLARDRIDVLQAAQQTLESSRTRLETERTTLQARLREALAPKPASLDPAELARAQERNLLLTKENEILKASLERQMAENKHILETAAKALELEKELGEARTELSGLRRENSDLRGERQKLLAKVEALGKKADPTAALRGEIEALKGEIEEARKGVGKPSLEAELELENLRADLARQRAAAQELKTDNATLVREIERLTAIKVSPGSLKAAEVPPVEVASVDVEKIRRLERERDDLRRALDVTRGELSRRDTDNAVRTAALTGQVRGLQARIATLEADAEPYTPEELALFQAPARGSDLAMPAQGTGVGAGAGALPASDAETRPKPIHVAQATPSAGGTTGTNAPAPSGAPETVSSAAPGTNGVPASGSAVDSSTSNPTPASGGGRRRTLRDLPPGASILAAQAQRAFTQRRFDDAERLYREILSLDERNVFTLGNLAAILVERGKLEEGEGLLTRALEVDPEDPFSLSLRGIIRFRQQRYDEAFDALSRSAQLDPENADTQNYLGITLSQRGQRKAAEAALRKALKLSPSSPAAHYNLAVVYATQKPPFLELARYHYEKARRSGQPANPAFEDLLRGESSPDSKSP